MPLTTFTPNVKAKSAEVNANFEGLANASLWNLTKAESRLGSNTSIIATSSLGTTLISFAGLPAGTYIFYGMGQCYYDNVAPLTGQIMFELNNGSAVLSNGEMCSFIFGGTEYGGHIFGDASAAFITVATLTATTTVNLAAYKYNLGQPVAGLNTRFGYIKIG